MPATPIASFFNSRFLSITCVFWLIAKLISYKVWMAYRLFPIVPVLGHTELPHWVHAGLFVLSLLCIGYVSIKPPDKRVMALLLITETIACLLDYTRWQPWEYQYLFIVFIFLFNKDQRVVRTVLLFLFAALYIYSGLHKINSGFLSQIWQNMILKSFLKMPHAIRSQEFIHYAGYAISAAEMLAGIALLFKATRKKSILFLIGIHLFNLIWLGPFGANYNLVVWPWNVFMICGLFYIAFADNNYRFTYSPLTTSANIIVLICWGILPLLNLWSKWDHYLSSSLYSGKLPLMVLCVDKSTTPELQPYIRESDPYNMCEGLSQVKIQSWAMAELNVPPYPEIRVYKKLNKILKQQYRGSSSSIYYYLDPDKRTVLE